MTGRWRGPWGRLMGAVGLLGPTLCACPCLVTAGSGSCRGNLGFFLMLHTARSHAVEHPPCRSLPYCDMCRTVRRCLLLPYCAAPCPPAHRYGDDTFTIFAIPTRPGWSRVIVANSWVGGCGRAWGGTNAAGGGP